MHTAHKFGLAKFDICSSLPVSKVILQHATQGWCGFGILKLQCLVF